jgi:HEXXH motif-containing protein
VCTARTDLPSPIDEEHPLRVLPDDSQALEERVAACKLVSTVLKRLAPQLSDEGAVPVNVPAGALPYPGLFAAAYDAQAACRRGRPPASDRRRLRARLENAVGQARDSGVRATAGGCPAWAVDLPPPEEHLRKSLARAVAQAPPRPDRTPALTALRVVPWTGADRRAFCEAACLLADAWPSMLSELAVVVRQVALLDGFGIDGFTDVATHGAVYLNRARLGPDDGGLPGPVRLAEALVHEGAHNRCNGAALTEPFLDSPSAASEPVVATPLRPDPRPLTGLFQQLVVLVRSLLLYDRLPAGRAVEARRAKLRGQAGQALQVIAGHTGRLSDHGRSVVAEAEELVARSDEARPLSPI